MRRRYLSPFILPVAAFAATILVGAVLLRQTSVLPEGLPWVDALFTATSAVCVTGLATVDTGTAFSREGHWVLLGLIQLGGLGIMTYSSLVFYLWRRRVSLTDRLAVGQALLHDPSFHLGNFLVRMVRMVLILELAGALWIYALEPDVMGPFGALFHAVSAFCNAGFSLFPDSLVRWKHSWGMNTVIMLLITLGGIGFAVIDECLRMVRGVDLGRRGLSYPAKLVLSTSALLTFGGAVLVFASEMGGGTQNSSVSQTVLSSLFQSVTCRTAGFNTLDIGNMTNVSLMIMIFLMFVGGSPGSCAGGIKTTALRILWSFMGAQFRGRAQVVVAGRAVSSQNMNKTFALLITAIASVLFASLLLSVTEGGDVPHRMVRGQLMDYLFETVSAFATVGLSTGITPTLSVTGKLCLTLLMFMGRIGPIWLLTTLQQMQSETRYRWPESDVPIG
ncbi:potassium transporter TrkH [Desulfovibrio subterraneus]|uniref:TrkH family potassium uptake protein n=1 Tax=Desulfovibrio subterraneus TaxID=2718620 RepID=UPI0022B882A5|nr:potassium transporter TrkG [Desulfovibrio subterraneus]WBF66739.1 potassium transporter TrkH [Desulfovibrio subterraneus]